MRKPKLPSLTYEVDNNQVLPTCLGPPPAQTEPLPLHAPSSHAPQGETTVVCLWVRGKFPDLSPTGAASFRVWTVTHLPVMSYGSWFEVHPRHQINTNYASNLGIRPSA